MYMYIREDRPKGGTGRIEGNEGIWGGGHGTRAPDSDSEIMRDAMEPIYIYSFLFFSLWAHAYARMWVLDLDLDAVLRFLWSSEFSSF